MAAMYTLLFSVLFMLLWNTVHPEYRTVEKNTPSLAVREHILRVAEEELGVREATGNNDGERIEEYLAYTGLGKGHAWCAASRKPSQR